MNHTIIKRLSIFKEDSPYQEILLTQGKIALIDTEDFSYISQFTWHWYRDCSSCVGHEGYARRNRLAGETGPVCITMHREILRPEPGWVADHIRVGSGLDNRRENLRIVGHVINARNSPIRRSNKSGYRGVSWDTRNGKWCAKVRHMGRGYHLGYFDTPEEASMAYIAGCVRMGLFLAPQEAILWAGNAERQLA